MQIFIYCKATLHVSGVTAPIIRNIKNCTRSLRYRSYFLYRYSPPTWSDRDWFVVTIELWGDRGGTVVKVLYYKSEGRWFDPSWCKSIFH